MSETVWGHEVARRHAQLSLVSPQVVAKSVVRGRKELGARVHDFGEEDLEDGRGQRVAQRDRLISASLG